MVQSENEKKNTINDGARKDDTHPTTESSDQPSSTSALLLEGGYPSSENDLLLQRNREHFDTTSEEMDPNNNSSHQEQKKEAQEGRNHDSLSPTVPAKACNASREGMGSAVHRLEEMDRAVANKLGGLSAVAPSATTAKHRELQNFEETHGGITEKLEESEDRAAGGSLVDGTLAISVPQEALIPGAYAVGGIGNGAEHNETMDSEILLWDLMNQPPDTSDANENTNNALQVPEMPAPQDPTANHDGLVTALPVMTEHGDEAPRQFALPAGDSTTAKPGFKKKHLWLCGIFVVFLVAVSVVSAVCGTGYCSSKDDPETNDEPGPSSAPSSSRYIFIQDFQKRIEADLGEDYFEESHPLFSLRDQALLWIVDSDPLKLDVDAINLVQRFILAIFQYQTSQERDWAACHPSKGKDSLEICFHPDRDQRSMRWLAQTHECEWAGVFCLSEMENDMNITEISLSKFDLSGALPTELFQLSHLNKLVLVENNISGTIPTEISNLSFLTWLNLGENLLTGSLPSQIIQLSQLVRLFVHQNSLSGTIPRDIFSLPALMDLVLFDNTLTGRLPVPALPQPNVLYVYLDNNMLTGMIPTEIVYLSSMRSLSLQGNIGLSGNIFSELAMLSDLEGLFVSRTAMGGTIPEELYYGLWNLVEFDVSDSTFSGTISTNLGLLSRLRYFSIQNNKFSGTIPNVQILSDLRTFTIHGNDLTGAFPMAACYGFQESTLSIQVTAQCPLANKSTASVVCPDVVGCCTECCDIETGECRPIP